jgi:aminopeptidase N
MLAKYDAAGPNAQFDMLPGLGEMLGRLDDPAGLAQGIGRIKDLTVKYKPYIDASRIIGLLRQVQERQSKRPSGAQAAALVQQAVVEIEAAK